MTTQLPISGLPMASVPLTGTEQVPMDQGSTTVRASIAQILSQSGVYLEHVSWNVLKSPLPAPVITAGSGNVNSSSSLTGIAYGNGIWVAIGYNGATPISLTSPDGVNWTINNVTPTWAFSGVYFTNNAFFSIDNVGFGALWRSTDGVTWTEVLIPADAALLLPVGFDGTHYAICEAGTLDWYYSLDGIAWTHVVGFGSPDSFDSNLAYGSFGGQNVWVACFSGNSGNPQVAVSNNITLGGSWVFSNPGAIAGAGGENSLFITNRGACVFDYPNSTTDVSYYGYNNWDSGTPPISPSFALAVQGPTVTYGGGMLCEVGRSSVVAGNGQAIQSSDGGSTWNPIPQLMPFPVLGDSASAVAFGQNQFIAVTNFGALLSYTPPPATL